MTRNVTAGFDDLKHRVAGSGSEVERAGHVLFKSQDVSTCEVNDMDVVAYAGAIWRVVVIAEDLDALTLAQRHAQHKRNQVRLGIMIFTVGFGRATGIEIAQEDRLHAVQLLVPFQRMLKH